MTRDPYAGLKHNSKLDVRLSDQLKEEFVARCQEEGVSTGTMLRSLIIDYVCAGRSPWMARAIEAVVARIRWVAGAVGAAGAAIIAAVALLFPPLASAGDDLALAYHVVVKNEADTAWRAVGRLEEFDDSFQPVEFPSTDIVIEVRVHECARERLETCGDDNVLVELNVHANEAVANGARARHASRMVLTKGQSGAIDTSLGDNLEMQVVFTPMQ